MSYLHKSFHNAFRLSDKQKNIIKHGVKIRYETPTLGRTLTGRIECICYIYDKSTSFFFCSEHNYDKNGLTYHGQAMQFYNRFDIDGFFTLFEFL